MRALAAGKERRVRALGENQGSLMSIDSAGDNFLRALHQRVTFLECVGFHGNSCLIIFRRQASASAVASRPSARMLSAGTSAKPAKENVLESLQLTALPHPNMRLILPSGDMPGRPAAVTAAARRRAP